MTREGEILSFFRLMTLFIIVSLNGLVGRWENMNEGRINDQLNG